MTPVVIVVIIIAALWFLAKDPWNKEKKARDAEKKAAIRSEEERRKKVAADAAEAAARQQASARLAARRLIHPFATAMDELSGILLSEQQDDFILSGCVLVEAGFYMLCSVDLYLFTRKQSDSLRATVQDLYFHVLLESGLIDHYIKTCFRDPVTPEALYNNRLKGYASVIANEIIPRGAWWLGKWPRGEDGFLDIGFLQLLLFGDYIYFPRVTGTALVYDSENADVPFGDVFDTLIFTEFFLEKILPVCEDFRTAFDAIFKKQ